MGHLIDAYEKTQLGDERDSLISEFSQKIQNLEKDVRDRLSKEAANTRVLALGLSNAVPGFNALPNVPAN